MSRFLSIVELCPVDKTLHLSRENPCCYFLYTAAQNHLKWDCVSELLLLPDHIYVSVPDQLGANIVYHKFENLEGIFTCTVNPPRVIAHNQTVIQAPGVITKRFWARGI